MYASKSYVLIYSKEYSYILCPWVEGLHLTDRFASCVSREMNECNQRKNVGMPKIVNTACFFPGVCVASYLRYVIYPP